MSKLHWTLLREGRRQQLSTAGVQQLTGLSLDSLTVLSTDNHRLTQYKI